MTTLNAGEGKVEELARIVWDARMKRGEELLGHAKWTVAWDEENETLHENVRIEVRALLTALRTPSEEMVGAIIQEHGCGYTINGKHVPCNHPSTDGLKDGYGAPLYQKHCQCVSSFTAAIDVLLTPKDPEQ